MNVMSNTIYSRRKQFLPEYREFFAVLLKIPDEDVRSRVTDAINGIQSCPNCNNKAPSKAVMDVGTQTEDQFFQNTDNANTEEQTIIKTENIEKRRRKRKRNCPKVVKTAQHSCNVPILKQDPDNQYKNTVDTEHQPPKIMRIDLDDIAVSSFLKSNSNVFNTDFDGLNQNTVETVRNQMKIEWEISDQYQGGLLPIHEAIVQNELNKLKRQLYVWKFRKCNLMSLVTEDNDNLIQLAIKENCLKIIIDELLKQDLDLNDVDDDFNNIIHLAILYLSNDDDLKQKEKIIQSLLEKVDLKLLLQKNDDGLTPLHLAVKRNEYLMAEKILNIVDNRLNLKSLARLDDSLADKDTFLRHYCRQCDNFKGRKINTFKQEILNATDMKRGCSVLYFAIELGHEHLVYLLLAHMCNPTIKNLAGSDAKTYYTEFGKNPSIGGVLDKLSTILQKQDDI